MNAPFLDSPAFDSRALHAAEQDVIAGAFLHPDRIGTTQLEPRHFTPGPHRELWTVLLALHAEGEAIDNLAVAERCEAAGQFENFAYLGEIVANYIDTDTWAHKAAKVQARSQQIDLWRTVAHAVETRDEATIVRAAEAITARAAAGSKRAVQATIDVAYQSMLDQWEADRGRPSLTWGLRKCDERVKPLKPTRLYVVAARPGGGKTALLMHIALANALAGRKVGILSVEQSMEELTARALCNLASSPLDWITGDDPQMPPGDARKIDEAKRQLRDLPIIINDQTPMTIAAATTWARSLVHRHGCEIIIVDYLQKLDADAKERRLEVAKVAKGLKNIARNLQVPVVVGAQMSRDAEGKAPTMANLGESAVIEHEADVVLALHVEPLKEGELDDNPSQKVSLLVLKNRHGPARLSIPTTFRRDVFRFEAFEGRYA